MICQVYRIGVRVGDGSGDLAGLQKGCAGVAIPEEVLLEAVKGCYGGWWQG